MATSSTLAIRPATHADEPAVVALLRSALGWPGDAPLADFFRWKHHANPFGPSPSWVAVDQEVVVGLRVLLRWEFESPAGRVRAVRAVDTATAPTHHGQGIFTRLTLHSVEACRDDGVAMVFNTPNDKSRPGYLKMGWEVVGRLPTSFRPCRMRGLPSLIRAGVPAERFSTATTAGDPVADVLDDQQGIADLLSSQPPPGGLRTPRSPSYLRWRYCGFEPLRYRAVVGRSGPSDGVAIFRLRRRGPALEAAVADVLAPDGDAGLRRRLLSSLAKCCGADYAVTLAPAGPIAAAGFAPLLRRGPVLTFRGLTSDRKPSLDEWQLGLGDVELF
jgi:GNAT superfamily N-acetyltransferase